MRSDPEELLAQLALQADAEGDQNTLNQIKLAMADEKPWLVLPEDFITKPVDVQGSTQVTVKDKQGKTVTERGDAKSVWDKIRMRLGK